MYAAPNAPQVCSGAAAVLGLIATFLNFFAAVSFPDSSGTTASNTSATWFSVTAPPPYPATLSMSLFESCLGYVGSCAPWSKGLVLDRFRGLAPGAMNVAGCPLAVGDDQALRQFWGAVFGSSAASTLLALSMVCSALLLVSTCCATNNHCLAARDGAAAQLWCAPLTGKRLAAALGALALALNLLGGIAGWATLGGLAQWLARREAHTAAAGPGCALVGLAAAGNLAALALAVQHPPPTPGQQLPEGSEEGSAPSGMGRADAVALP